MVKNIKHEEHTLAAFRAYSNRAAASSRSSGDAEAFDDLNKALSLRPGVGVVLMNRAAALAQLGRYEDAMTDVELALELSKHYEPPVLQRMYDMKKALMKDIDGLNKQSTSQ